MRNYRIFECMASSIQYVKLYFLRTLCCWSQVLGHSTKLTCLVFVNMIFVQSSRGDRLLLVMDDIPWSWVVTNFLISHEKKLKFACAMLLM